MFRRILMAATVALVGYGTHAIAQEEPYAPVIDPANFVSLTEAASVSYGAFDNLLMTRE